MSHDTLRQSPYALMAFHALGKSRINKMGCNMDMEVDG